MRLLNRFPGPPTAHPVNHLDCVYLMCKRETPRRWERERRAPPLSPHGGRDSGGGEAETTPACTGDGEANLKHLFYNNHLFSFFLTHPHERSNPTERIPGICVLSCSLASCVLRRVWGGTTRGEIEAFIQGGGGSIETNPALLLSTPAPGPVDRCCPLLCGCRDRGLARGGGAA